MKVKNTQTNIKAIQELKIKIKMKYLGGNKYQQVISIYVLDNNEKIVSILKN